MQVVKSIVETLFASRGPAQQPVTFVWRLVRRKGKPFLLLPLSVQATRAGLNLYSAQRPLAKMWRAALPTLLRRPVARLFPLVEIQVDAASKFMGSLAQEAGVPATALLPMPIKFSETRLHSRVVMLLCDESGRPTSVVKAGLDDEGRADIKREADVLAQLPPEVIGGIRMRWQLDTPAMVAFATNYFPGPSPANDSGMEHLFHSWLSQDQPVPLASLPLWTELERAATSLAADSWRVLRPALADANVRHTIYHGDFTPWNVRVINSRNLEAFDWERGSLHGIPGWDWFHFISQTAILARRHPVARIAAELETLIESDRFGKYAAAAGIGVCVRPLLLAYLLHQQLVVRPVDGIRKLAELFDFLACRWHLNPSSAAGNGRPPGLPEDARGCH